MRTAAPIAPEVCEFLAQREREGCSPGTLKCYRLYLARWVAFCGEPMGDPERLHAFLDQYDNHQTRRCYWRHIRAFVRWLANRQDRPDWTRGLRLRFQPAVPPRPLTVDEFRRILRAIPDTHTGRLFKTLYLLLFATGARRDEVRLLRRGDVDLDRGEAFIVGKGRKANFLYIPKQAREAVAAWLNEAPGQWIFAERNRPEAPISADRVSRRLAHYAREAGIRRRVYVHLLRHSFACLLINEGTPLEVIQKVLRHSDMATTQRYARLSRERQVAEIERVFGNAWGRLHRKDDGGIDLADLSTPELERLMADCAGMLAERRAALNGSASGYRAPHVLDSLQSAMQPEDTPESRARAARLDLMTQYLQERERQGVAPATVEAERVRLHAWERANGGAEGVEAVQRFLGGMVTHESRRKFFKTVQRFMAWRAARDGGEDWAAGLALRWDRALGASVLEPAGAGNGFHLAAMPGKR